MNTEILNQLKFHKKGTKVEWRKLEEMNQLGLLYIYTWKYHKETPCVATFSLNKLFLNFFFFFLL
jgi:hypothetical protein